jgi:[CysO sulfur-carrier protein]-S-L-cysteine hydrolase
MAAESSARDVLAIDRSTLDEVVAHLRRALPNEGVGLLATDMDAGRRRVARFFPGTNVDASPSRFTMDPGEVVDAFRVMRASGWAFGAIVHSHPATEPAPSPTDAREAHYPDALLLIVSFAKPDVLARVWKVLPRPDGTAGGFTEALLEIVD